jgi:hypothetical protein
MLYLTIAGAALGLIGLIVAVVALFLATRAARAAEALRPDPRRVLSVWKELEPAEAAGQLGAYLEQVGRKLQTLDTRTQELLARSERAYSRLGFTRFDSTEEIKGHLSFSLAVLDAHHDGFVLTTLTTLQGSRTYLRPVQQGRVERDLMPEEAEALRVARGEVASRESRDASGNVPVPAPSPPGAEA